MSPVKILKLVILFILSVTVVSSLTGCASFETKGLGGDLSCAPSCQSYLKNCDGKEKVYAFESLITSCIDLTTKCASESNGRCRADLDGIDSNSIFSSTLRNLMSHVKVDCSFGSGTGFGDICSSQAMNLPSESKNTTAPTISTSKPAGATASTSINNGTPDSQPSSKCGSNQFTGLSVSAGYAYSQTNANGASGVGNTGNITVGYTSGLGCPNISGITLQPTVAAVVSQNIGSMGSANSVATATTTTSVCYNGPFVVPCGPGLTPVTTTTSTTTTNTTKISHTTALTLQPGVVIGSTQIYANGGAVITNKNNSTATGSRVGGGVCQGVRYNLSACVEGNHDQISGAGVNSVSTSLKFTLP